MTSIDLKPATADLIKRFYGRVPRTAQAYVAVKGEKVLGVAGLYQDGDKLIAFTDLGETRQSKRTIVQGARLLMPLIRAARMPVFALCDPAIEGASTLLEHYGFRPVGEGVYQWQG